MYIVYSIWEGEGEVEWGRRRCQLTSPPAASINLGQPRRTHTKYYLLKSHHIRVFQFRRTILFSPNSFSFTQRQPKSILILANLPNTHTNITLLLSGILILVIFLHRQNLGFNYSSHLICKHIFHPNVQFFH